MLQINDKNQNAKEFQQRCHEKKCYFYHIHCNVAKTCKKVFTTTFKKNWKIFALQKVFYEICNTKYQTII